MAQSGLWFRLRIINKTISKTPNQRLNFIVAILPITWALSVLDDGRKSEKSTFGD